MSKQSNQRYIKDRDLNHKERAKDSNDNQETSNTYSSETDESYSNDSGDED